jgi:hypothetical protein
MSSSPLAPALAPVLAPSGLSGRHRFPHAGLDDSVDVVLGEAKMLSEKGARDRTGSSLFPQPGLTYLEHFGRLGGRV